MFDDKTIAEKISRIPHVPETLMVLGSGWNRVLEDAKIRAEYPFSELFGVSATVPGHEGRFIVADLGHKPVAFMSGRIHMYEGFSAREATAPFRAFAQAGVKKMILTAASGALNENYRIGDIVILNDLITLLLALDSPLQGPQFIDTSSVFDADMRQQAITIAKKNSIPFQEGSYIYYHGPNYETPGDKRALRILGADVCGMSTVPETLTARSLGIKVLGLAFVTNLAFVKHDHKEVLKEAENGSGRMKIMLTSLL